MLRNMVAVLAAIGLVFALAAALPVQGQQSPFPYPRSTKPVESVIVYSDMYLDPQDNLLITLLTLGGGLARSQPRLYRIPKLYSPTPSDDSYSTWLTTMRKHCSNQKLEIDLSMIRNPYHILSLFRKDITGYVLYNTSDGSVNAALTYIAAQNSSELLVATSATSNKTMSMLKSWNIPFVADVSGLREGAVYKSRGGIKAFSGNMISFQHPELYPNLAEYAIFARMPTLEYSTDTKRFPDGGDQVRDAIAEFGATNGIKAAFGWGPEYQYVSKLGEHGFFVHASDMAHNVAVLSNYKCLSVREDTKSTKNIEMKFNGVAKLLGDDHKHRIAFLMTDGDNLQWLMNSFTTSENWGGSKSRGQIPIGWTISPGLNELASPIIAYLKETRTPNDDFVGAPSGKLKTCAHY